jgi:hypothetical protein
VPERRPFDSEPKLKVAEERQQPADDALRSILDLTSASDHNALAPAKRSAAPSVFFNTPALRISTMEALMRVTDTLKSIRVRRSLALTSAAALTLRSSLLPIRRCTADDS